MGYSYTICNFISDLIFLIVHCLYYVHKIGKDESMPHCYASDDSNNPLEANAPGSVDVT